MFPKDTADRGYSKSDRPCPSYRLRNASTNTGAGEIFQAVAPSSPGRIRRHRASASKRTGTAMRWYGSGQIPAPDCERHCQLQSKWIDPALAREVEPLHRLAI